MALHDNRYLQELIDAVEENNLPAVKKIVAISDEEGSSFNINGLTHDGEMAGMTALALATSLSAEDIVLFLLKRCDIDANIPDKSGRTPLMLAIETLQEKVVARLLVEEIDVNFADDSANTPLSKAIEGGNNQILHMVLAHPEIDVNMCVYKDCTPLHLAYRLKKFLCMYELLQHPNCDTSALDTDGVPFFNCVCAMEKHDIVHEVCKRAGRIDFTLVDSIGGTCLHSACDNIYRDIDVLRLVLASFPEIDVNAMTQSGETPLSFAARNKWEDAVVELLRAPGIDVNIPNESSETPLHIASKLKAPNIVRWLVHIPALEINARTKNGETALFLAAREGSTESLKMLLSRKDADPNIYCETEELTPVAVACDRGHEDCVYELISHGADVHRPNQNGIAPIWLAANKGHTYLVDYFVNKGLVVNEDDIPMLLAKARTMYFAGLVDDFNRRVDFQNEHGSSDASAYEASFVGSQSEAALPSAYHSSELDLEEKRDLESNYSCHCCQRDDHDEPLKELEIEYFIEHYFCDNMENRSRLVNDPSVPGTMVVRAQCESDSDCDSDLSESRGEGERGVFAPEPRPIFAPLAQKSISILRTIFKPKQGDDEKRVELVSHKDDELTRSLPSIRSWSSRMTSLFRSESREIDEDDGKERSPQPFFFNIPRSRSEPLTSPESPIHHPQQPPARSRSSILVFHRSPLPQRIRKPSRGSVSDEDEPKMGFYEPITPSGSEWASTPGMESAVTPGSGMVFGVPPKIEPLEAFQLDCHEDEEMSVFQAQSEHRPSSGSLSPMTCMGYETLCAGDETENDTVNGNTILRQTSFWDQGNRARGNAVFVETRKPGHRKRKSLEDDFPDPVVVMGIEPIYTSRRGSVEGDTPM